MYNSLVQHCPESHLYIFAFDDLAADILQRMNLPQATIIPLSEFETEQLLSIKQKRSIAEYCWTCTPSVIDYSIRNFNLSSCTYLDADLYFFSDPTILIKEMGNDSVLLTAHRYTPQYDQSVNCGIYCVQFMTFKNTVSGLKALEWWRQACIDWCYARFEEGKFGDQKYLDDWPVRFEGVHVSGNLGGGIAPWNVQQYEFIRSGDEVKCRHEPTGQLLPIIFYHFHEFTFLKDNFVNLGPYKIEKETKAILYKDYLEKIIGIEKDLHTYSSDKKIMGIKQVKKNIVYYLRRLKRKFKGTDHLISREKLLNI